MRAAPHVRARHSGDGPRPAAVMHAHAGAAWVLGALVASALAVPASAQRRTLSLPRAVELAFAHHPAVRRTDAGARAAHARARVAESALLPRLDVSLDLQRATGNVIAGTQLPMPGIPQVSGPPAPTQLDSGVWGSGVGAAASFDVGAIARREREHAAARAAAAAEDAFAEATRLELAHRVSSAYLDLVLASARREVVGAWRTRAEAWVRITDALVQQELRAGSDASRARAELAAADAFAAQAREAEGVARATLGATLGDPALDVDVDMALSEPRASIERAPHALARAREAELQSAQRAREAQALAYVPSVEAMAAVWARGSGIMAPNRASGLGDAVGLVPNVPNWAAGIVVSYGLLDLPAIEARVAEADARTDEAAAALDEETLALRTLEAQARARVEGAREVARAVPVAVDAYRAALDQAEAQYRAGLADLLDVVDAQRALAQAELGAVDARVALLRALYALAYARGDLDAFLRSER